jgi:hypothetical protein
MPSPKSVLEWLVIFLFLVLKLKPYVAMDAKITAKQRKDVYGKLPQGGLTGSHYYDYKLWKREQPSSTTSIEET